MAAAYALGLLGERLAQTDTQTLPGLGPVKDEAAAAIDKITTQFPEEP